MSPRKLAPMGSVVNSKPGGPQLSIRMRDIDDELMNSLRSLRRESLNAESTDERHEALAPSDGSDIVTRTKGFEMTSVPQFVGKVRPRLSALFLLLLFRRPLHQDSNKLFSGLRARARQHCVGADGLDCSGLRHGAQRCRDSLAAGWCRHTAISRKGKCSWGDRLMLSGATANPWLICGDRCHG